MERNPSLGIREKHRSVASRTHPNWTALLLSRHQSTLEGGQSYVSVMSPDLGSQRPGRPEEPGGASLWPGLRGRGGETRGAGADLQVVGQKAVCVCDVMGLSPVSRDLAVQGPEEDSR